MGFGAFSVRVSSVDILYTNVTVMSQRLKSPLSTSETSPHEVGGVNPNNVRRTWVSFSQPPPTRWPSDRVDYHILYMLYSAHTSGTRRGGRGAERPAFGKEIQISFLC